VRDVGQLSDVLIDLCVQKEYLAPDGVRRVQNASLVCRNIKRLMAFARWAKLPVLSCVDTRRPTDLGPDWFAVERDSPPERRKTAHTLLPDRAVVESDNSLCISLDVLRQHQQTIFTKYHRDPFTNPKLDRILTEMAAGRFIVFGAPLETSLRILVLGLVRRGRSVVVIEDACGYWDAEEAAMIFRQFAVKGCTLVDTERFLETELARRRRSLRPRPGARRSVA
jgi:nicotinamidase-related amidase